MSGDVLPDVNLLLALFVQGHGLHLSARAWYDKADSPVLVLCRLSQVGFLRLLTTRGMMQGDVLTNVQAWRLFDGLLSNSVVRLVADTPGIESAFRRFSHLNSASPQRWSDAYLAAFAVQQGLSLVTFDKALAKLSPKSVLLRP